MEHVFETLETDACLGVVVDGTMAITGVTAQREEVVRCRDCEDAMEHRSKSIIGTELVTLTCSGPIQGAYSEGADVEPEDFCSWASAKHWRLNYERDICDVQGLGRMQGTAKS